MCQTNAAVDLIHYLFFLQICYFELLKIKPESFLCCQFYQQILTVFYYTSLSFGLKSVSHKHGPNPDALIR